MWRGMIIDSWRETLRARKKHLALSNAKLGEIAGFSEGVIERDLKDHSDPPLSHIVAIADALGVPVADLFSPTLPNGMTATALLEDYARVCADNHALKVQVEDLRHRVDELKDELLAIYRKQ